MAVGKSIGVPGAASSSRKYLGIFAGDAILQRLREDRISRARDALQRLGKALRADGYRSSIVGDSLLARLPSGSIRVVLKDGRVDEAAAAPLLAWLRSTEDGAAALICWDASLSVIREAKRGSDLVVFILSRMERAGGAESIRLLEDSLEAAGLSFGEFISAAENPDSALEAESRMMALESALESAARELARSASFVWPERLADAVERLRRRAREGAPEAELNLALMDLLEAAGCLIDRDRSMGPGRPDVVALAPLWTLFELKNERADLASVGQAKEYLDEYRETGRLSKSGAGVMWGAWLVATSASAEIVSKGRREGVAVLTWDQVCDVLRAAFLRAFPLDLARIKPDDLAKRDPWDILRLQMQGWEDELGIRSAVLRILREAGALQAEEILSTLLASGLEVDARGVERILTELSGPLIGLVELGELGYSLRVGEAAGRAHRAIWAVTREVLADG